MAVNSWGAGSPLRGGPIADLLGLAGILLYVEGFRQRRGATGPGWLLPTVGAATATVLILTALAPPMTMRAAITPAISALLLGWAATKVVPPAQPGSAAERAVVWMLILLALIHAAAAMTAVAEQIGIVGTHRYYVLIYAVTIEPTCAAVTLFSLLLIAFDFSADLRRVVHTDPLTGVLNRIGFEHALQAAADRRRTRRLSIAIADIDFFKQINDRHGHAAGDATLASFAGHLAGQMGRDAQVARIGGEEFALLMPDVGGEDAFRRIDPVRESLSSLRVEGHPDVDVTASFGVAERRTGENLDAVVERADRALYQSKREGRNRSTLAQALSS